MKRIVKRKWLTPEDAYVEVSYNPRWNNGEGWVDVSCFVRDPRKAQHHKPKYWVRGSAHGPASCNWRSKGAYACNSRFYQEARKIFKEELRLTSSVGRAPAPREREVAGLIPASGFKPCGTAYIVSKSGELWQTIEPFPPDELIFAGNK